MTNVTCPNCGKPAAEPPKTITVKTTWGVSPSHAITQAAAAKAGMCQSCFEIAEYIKLMKSLVVPS